MMLGAIPPLPIAPCATVSGSQFPAEITAFLAGMVATTFLMILPKTPAVGLQNVCDTTNGGRAVMYQKIVAPGILKIAVKMNGKHSRCCGILRLRNVKIILRFQYLNPNQQCHFLLGVTLPPKTVPSVETAFGSMPLRPNLVWPGGKLATTQTNVAPGCNA